MGWMDESMSIKGILDCIVFLYIDVADKQEGTVAGLAGSSLMVFVLFQILHSHSCHINVLTDTPTKAAPTSI